MTIEALKSHLEVRYLSGRSALGESSTSMGQSPIPIHLLKNPTLFAARLAMLLAQRYPSVDAWQIWNEPNLPTFWQSNQASEAWR